MSAANLPPPKHNKLPRERTREPRRKRASTWQDRRRRYLIYNGRLEQLRKEGLQ